MTTDEAVQIAKDFITINKIENEDLIQDIYLEAITNKTIRKDDLLFTFKLKEYIYNLNYDFHRVNDVNIESVIIKYTLNVNETRLGLEKYILPKIDFTNSEDVVNFILNNNYIDEIFELLLNRDMYDKVYSIDNIQDIMIDYLKSSYRK